MVKQVSIFLENRSGRLYEVTHLLANNKIDIKALSVADTSDFGILRLIVDQTEKAEEVLRKEKWTVSITDVIAVEVEDKPGGLAKVLKIFDENKMNVEYMYSYLCKNPDKAVMIFRFDNNPVVIEKLKSTDIKMIGVKDLNNL